jgi:hypothetical protein
MACEEADGAPRWHRFQLSALTHPNVLAELAGEPPPIPGAVKLSMVREWLADWCERVDDPGDVRATDVEFPPGSGQWFRPGPIFQARAMGLWPDTGSGVWSPALWAACFPSMSPHPTLDRLPEIGVDCSMGKGEDYFALHARWGAISWHHETSNTMDAVRIADRVRQVCALMAGEVRLRMHRNHAPIDPKSLRVKVDDDGTGNAVVAMLKRDGYNTTLVSAATRALHPDQYPRMRDEAWFQCAAKARGGLVNLTRLDKRTLARLRQQLLAPEWDVNPMGLRAVERKDDTKEKIGRSPDDADAMNLAYLDLGVSFLGEGVPNDRSPLTAFGGAHPQMPRLQGLE